jgi:hypothetical protein
MWYECVLESYTQINKTEELNVTGYAHANKYSMSLQNIENIRLK